MILTDYKRKLNQSGQIYLLCKVFPSAAKTEIKGLSRSEVEGRATETIEINLAAPAQQQKANQALIKFLAREFCLPSGQINIINGRTSRLKLLRLRLN